MPRCSPRTWLWRWSRWGTACATSVACATHWIVFRKCCAFPKASCRSLACVLAGQMASPQLVLGFRKTPCSSRNRIQTMHECSPGSMRMTSRCPSGIKSRGSKRQDGPHGSNSISRSTIAPGMRSITVNRVPPSTSAARMKQSFHCRDVQERSRCSFVSTYPEF